MRRTLGNSDIRYYDGRSARTRLVVTLSLVAILGALVLSVSGMSVSTGFRSDFHTQAISDRSDTSETGFGYDKYRSESRRPVARAVRVRSILKSKIARQNDALFVPAESIRGEDGRRSRYRFTSRPDRSFETPKDTSRSRMNYFAHRGPPQT